MTTSNTEEYKAYDPHAPRDSYEMARAHRKMSVRFHQLCDLSLRWMAQHGKVYVRKYDR